VSEPFHAAGGDAAGIPEAGRALWDLAIDAAGVGTFDLDPVTGTLTWDDRMLALFGYVRSEFGGTVDAFRQRVHPDDLPRVLTALQSAVDTCGTFEVECRVVRPDGTRWVQARGRTLCDESGAAVRLLGAAYDTTVVHEGETRTTRVLETMSAAFYALDRQWRFSYVNAEAERLLGRPREELLGGNLWALYPATVGSQFEASYTRAMDSGESVVFDAYYPEPLNGWYELRVWPSPDGLGVYFLDVTARKAALSRAALLSEATAALTDTLVPEEAVARLARIVVPALGSACIVTLVDDDADPQDWRRQLRDLSWWHDQPELRPVLDRYARARLPDFDDRSLVSQALREGRPIVVHDAAEAIAATLRSPETQQLIRQLAPRSAVMQPMRARGRTLGLLTIYWNDRDEPRQEDLDTIAELGGRAGLALDNARLYEQQRRLAEGLQRSLLTAPPEPNHLQIVVRYEPAAAAAEVGGDWYDAFMQADGATMLVIGDVVGHDVNAAAAMGQVRGLLRGIAATTGDGPAAVLSRLDSAMDLLRVGTTATAAVARFEQTPEERDIGLTRLTWSNAGHPPPVLIGSDGGVVVLDGGVSGQDEADLLLGIDPQSHRREFEIRIMRPATLLLYTDGLVEQRGQSLDDGLARLVATARELVAAGLGLDDLCDELLDRMLPERSQDDVAITAVRLHPLDRPRPAEAGPQVIPPGVPDPPD
jgi:serine phosphatase RsbU (regulator of sigma subunit)/PAS domain-containing protein